MRVVLFPYIICLLDFICFLHKFVLLLFLNVIALNLTALTQKDCLILHCSENILAPLLVKDDCFSPPLNEVSVLLQKKKDILVVGPSFVTKFYFQNK